DFESHVAFTINSPGKLRWSYIDGDKQYTWAISNVKFPNQEEKMAYIVFEPEGMTPDMSSAFEFKSHSGKKYLASPFVNKGSNNDYLISPKLNFDKPFLFSFYAKGFIEQNIEKFHVGYSTTNNADSSFIPLTLKPMSPPITWKKYKYEIPAEAKYVYIQNVADDGFIFMLDDIFIGDPGVDIETETPKQTLIATYPNPVKTILHLENPCQEVTIYDLMGRKMLNQVGSINTIDMQAFENGVYVLKAMQGGQTLTAKILVKK
ncbi:MAG: choice-of-anchor J domain-containing protein, partial [Bacteroidales bacterium]